MFKQDAKWFIMWFQKISIPPPQKTFWFAPPSPQDFLFQGVFDDPPPLRHFQNFCTYKKESDWISWVNTVEFYYNSVNIKVNF